MPSVTLSFCVVLPWLSVCGPSVATRITVGREDERGRDTRFGRSKFLFYFSNRIFKLKYLDNGLSKL
jgi:hypothetical protein